MPSLSPKTILRRLGLRPKKSWGQHFLLHPHQARRLAEALELGPGAVVVEIGGGLGALTVFLAKQAHRLVVLERDPALAEFLRAELVPHHPCLEIVCQDVLTFDFLKLRQDAGRVLEVAGNLPYQITSPLLFKLIQEKAAISRAVLMMQQEVGDRLLAGPGTKDYGIVTVLLQYHFQLTRLFSLSPANFYPPPQVASVVLRLVTRQDGPQAQDEALLSRVVKAAFAKRRKTLQNTLVAQSAAFGLPPEEIRAALTALNIDPGRRGETLSVPQFVALSNRLAEKRRERVGGISNQ
ncbi:MAG: 16S rRNA (adenine(1518)-N(6)/adenine(1519)-N(6))-dimethyltransferase RsmA [Thermodesulfobacteriota bacterium]